MSDNKFDKNKVFDLLIDVPAKEYLNDEYSIRNIAEKINSIVDNSMDIIGAEMVLISDIINIEKEEAGKIYYRYLDFDVKNNSFFNNLNDFFKNGKGSGLA